MAIIRGEIEFSDEPQPHEKDGKLVDEIPNVVRDEEGFIVAQFRYYADAKSWCEAVNGSFPCAEYYLEGDDG